MNQMHEDFQRDEPIQRSSNRTLGLVFAAFFGLVALLPLVRGHSFRIWPLPFSVVFLVTALVAPTVLTPLNRAWTALAILLHKVTNPLVLGICFYVVFTPFAWLLRRMGKDFLRVKRDPNTDSYWIARQPPGPPPESMSNQF